MDRRAGEPVRVHPQSEAPGAPWIWEAPLASGTPDLRWVELFNEVVEEKTNVHELAWERERFSFCTWEKEDPPPRARAALTEAIKEANRRRLAT